MNAELLLAHFDRISDAPGAVPRLRRFILDLAVRGKLVEQDPCDQPARMVVSQIIAEKNRLTAQGLIPKMKLALPVGSDKVRFEIPESWYWVRLSHISSYIQRGRSPQYAAGDGLPVISQKCVQWQGLDLGAARMITRESIASYEQIRFLRHDDLLWNSTGTGAIGRVVKINNPPDNLVCDSHVTVVRTLGVDAEFVRTWLRSDNVYGSIEDCATGSTNQVELTLQMALEQSVPLPPLAEQHRIVAKVDELMALCDRLEAEQRERERRRDRLTAATHHHLNNGADAEAVRSHAQFFIGHLPRLTTRPDQIKQLRQTILNLAVRGKLVPQLLDDEPSEHLIKRMKSRMASMFRDSTLRKTKACRSYADNEVPHDIPESWKWTMLGEITDIGTGGTPSRTEARFWNGSIPWVTSGSTSSPVIYSCEECITKDAVYAHRLRLYQPRTLLVALYGQGKTRGQVAELGIEATINQACAAVVALPGFESVHPYIRVMLEKNYDEVRLLSAGGTQPNLNVQKIKEMMVPLPPLAEQHRIVAKVDELMALCDQLEARLTTAQTEASRLLGSVLHNALNAPAPSEAFQLLT